MNFNKEAHERMWLWLADRPDNSMEDYFIENNIPRIKNDMYPCEYADKQTKSKCTPICFKCPIFDTYEWCSQEGSLMREYSHFQIKENKKKGHIALIHELAKKIANKRKKYKWN